MSQLELRGAIYFQRIRYTEEEAQKLRIISRQELCRLRRRSMGNKTQEAYAEMCGVSANLIKRLESDKPYNPIGFSSEVCLKVLGVSKDFIYDHVDWLYVREQQ